MPNNQPRIFLNVKMPGETPFTLTTFHGREKISTLFEYTLIITAQSREVSFDSLMGEAATVSLRIGSQEQTYNGIIGQFEQDDTPFAPLDAPTVYRATLYPNLWLLTFSGQCRIFQNKSALDIIKSVLDEHHISYADQVGSAGRASREFCVQYNETDFNFISRLMEAEGIFYFFLQEEAGHRLVLADSAEAHPFCAHASSVSFHDAADADQVLVAVSSCFIRQRIVSENNTLKSYNYLTPQTALKALSAGRADAKGGDITRYAEVYDTQSRGDALSKVQIQAMEAPQKMVEGISTVPFFLAGHKYGLKGHPREDANITYVLDEVVHEAHLEKHLYRNRYTAFPASVAYRPPQKTPKPHIYGTQTAKVTGKPEEEIYTEEYGRIKVKFHWDPSDRNDETTSCWIRVATLWAGKTWGTLFTPRIGHEVVVSFIDGDPDKPIVVGSVYNGDNKPPYLPSTPTKSTLKSQTSKKEGVESPGFNEFRFEDKKGSEEIYIHAQKDFKVDIQNNYDISIVGGNRTIVLKSEAEKEEERAGEQSNDSLKLINGNKSLQIIKGNYSIQLDEGNITVKCAKGNVSFDVDGNVSFKCTGNFGVDAAKAISFKAGEMIKAEAGTDVSVTAGAALTMKAGADVSVTAGAAATMKAGADFAVTAGAAASVTGGGDASVEGGGALSLTGGGTASLKGATVEVAGALITLNG